MLKGSPTLTDFTNKKKIEMSVLDWMKQTNYPPFNKEFESVING